VGAKPGDGRVLLYASIYEESEEWPVFSTQDECESSCRCRDVTPIDFSLLDTIGDAALSTERTSLECFCRDGRDCPEAFAETATSFCAGGGSPQLTQFVGCGRKVVRSFADYSLADWSSSASMSGRTTRRRKPARTRAIALFRIGVWR
jgi:hypothetical protein